MKNYTLFIHGLFGIKNRLAVKPSGQIKPRLSKTILSISMLVSFLMPVVGLAGNVLLANKPMADSTVSDILPNLMFTLDNSGSMSQDYTPDWAGNGSASQKQTPAYNTQYYNPNIKYTPPVDYTGVSYPNQTNYKAVANDGFLGGGTTNLTKSAQYYNTIAKEYCTTPHLISCTKSATSTGAYIYPALIRWCNTSANATATTPAANSCQAIRRNASTGFLGFTNMRAGTFVLVKIVSTNNSYPAAGVIANSARTDCTANSSCTYAQEMTNYANWFAYYSTRILGMKTAVSLAFQHIDDHYRVGFYTINDSAANYLPITQFTVGAKQIWYNKFFSIVPGGGTPLRSALSTVGRIYAGKKPIGNSDPVQYACQKNYALLTTDGYWNTDWASNVKDVTGGAIGDLDSDPTTRPLYEGAATALDATAKNGSLADTAKYYYDTDLRTTAFGNCTGALGQLVCGEEPANLKKYEKQNMTTLTLGLGVDGTLQYSTDYKTQTSGDYADIKSNAQDWPVPVQNTETAVDDLWHAAVNANGTYFSAKDPKQLTDSLTQALLEITSNVGAGSAAAASSLQPTAGNNTDYIASYQSVKWTGNLEARSVDLTTLQMSQSDLWCAENVAAGTCTSPATLVSSGGTFYCKTTASTPIACSALGGTLTGTDCNVGVANACTGKMKGKVSTISDTRQIMFNSGGNLANFSYGSLNSSQKAYFEAPFLSSKLSQWSSYTAGVGGQQQNAVGNGIVNYLRGQQGFENITTNVADKRLFRAREATLGDITESQPAYIAKPLFSYTDAGYAAFKTANNTRAGMIYVGANDGMLHAFNAADGTEAWAFVPTPVIPKMWALADYGYAANHVNLVNGDPVVTDVFINGQWRTILVAGLGGGGRGYYALDVTDPAALPTLLWEYTSANQSNLGYSFGTPVITKLKDGTWVALVTSGYNNGTTDNDGVTNNSPTGDGVGYVYALNAATGSLMKTFSTTTGTPTTPSGLAQISAFVENLTSNRLATYVYGGDLLGNLWRFDITAASGTAPFKLATLMGIGSTVQPITTKPELGYTNASRVVFVGTGKYLEVADLSNTDVQTIYAIKDTGTPLGSPRANTGFVPLTISGSGTTRTVSATKFGNFATGLGWFADLPDTGERMNLTPLLVKGVLLAPTIVPSTTSCTPGGYGWFNYFDYKTGASPANFGGVVSERLGSPSAGFGVVYDASGNVTVINRGADGSTVDLKNKKLSSDGGSDRTTIFKKNGDGTYGQKSIWRELSK